MMHSAKAKLLSVFLMAGTILSPVSTVQAFDPSQPPHLVEVGPKDPLTGEVILSPQTNFPVYYQDHTGLALELCTANNDQLNMCIFDPIDTSDAETLEYQRQIGFNAEAFWWTADAALTMPASQACPDCSSGQITLAVEAAFNQERPKKGDEFMFGRIRIRVDAPYAGTYTVKHPFGSQKFVVTAPGKRAINETIDIGSVTPDPTGPLRSGIMAFLRWDPAVGPAPPQGYIGDPNVPHPVVGSPLDQNYFRVEYEGTEPIGQNGEKFVQQNDFSISGRLYSGVTPAPLVVDRASYSGNRVELFARSAPTATLSVLFDDQTEAKTLVGDGKGNFWYAASGSAMPKVARVTAKNAENTDTQINTPVSDVVDITEAKYDPAAKKLSITAKSSSETAVLKMVGFGEPTVGYTGATEIPNVAVPPAVVMVRSDKGGVDQEPVLLLGDSNGTPGGEGPGGEDPGGEDPGTGTAPVANADSAETVAGTPVTIDVALNDTASGGATVSRSTVVITTPPQKGTIGLIGVSGVTYTPNATFKEGSDTFQYKISDSQGRVSQSGTVTVTLIAEQLALTEATYRTGTLSWVITGTSNARIGNTVSAYYGTYTEGATTNQLIGSAPVDAAGVFDIRVDRSAIVGRTGGTVTLVSSKGKVLSGQAITVRR
jgi:hypothetical protein